MILSVDTSRGAQTACTVNSDWALNGEDIVMKSSLLLASIGTLAAVSGVSSLAHADESHRDSGAPLRADHRPSEGTRESASGRSGMQPVPTTAGPGEPGHGWRYFSNPLAGSAVVISPQGEYFLSRGRGLRLIAVTRSGS